jgi:hypothetical protein
MQTFYRKLPATQQRIQNTTQQYPCNGAQAANHADSLVDSRGAALATFCVS